jgi:hypothetical protein
MILFWAYCARRRDRLDLGVQDGSGSGVPLSHIRLDGAGRSNIRPKLVQLDLHIIRGGEGLFARFTNT